MHSAVHEPMAQTRERTVSSHRSLLKALRSGKEDAAAAAMHDHIKSWSRQYPRVKGRGVK